ncbi:hypothetical protein DRO35_02350 [Candidatus Bathyarchaeota archaeon]|nr:MAG: hypothetical protein DRO35_02350 [Candidatus Bathyarchaeota archaeon]
MFRKAELPGYLYILRKRIAYIVAGICERVNCKLFNSDVLVYPDGKFFSICRKAHLFHKEKLWFTPGDTPF